MSDHEDHTTDERASETSTDNGAQNMPSSNAFADIFKAVMAPVLSQLSNLKDNVSSVLLNGHDDSDENGETASNDGPAKSADMDADLSAPQYNHEVNHSRRLAMTKEMHKDYAPL